MTTTRTLDMDTAPNVEMDSTDRITRSLASLKTELEDLRSQDVLLLKQLMEIHNKIKGLSRNSETSDLRLSGSSASLEDSSSSSDDVSETDHTEPAYNVYNTFPRTSSKCHNDRLDTINYENILRRNIRLWKHSKSISQESLNSLCTII